MSHQETFRLVSGLASAAARRAAADALAAHLGAAGLLILVDDPIVESLVPAPGFAQTLPGGPAWRGFLQRAREGGAWRDELPCPSSLIPVPALGYAGDGILLVLFGRPSSPPPGDAVEVLAPALPLIAAMLCAEQAALAAHGELRVAQHHARDVELLASALDAARAQTEQTVVQLEHQARALEHARTRAEEATRAKDEFLAMLGHELRNPLSPIVTALQLMRMKKQSSREQDVIERQVTSLMQLVDDLLDVSRITRGKIELRKTPVELSEVAARAIEMVSPMLEKKQQVLKVDIPVTGLVVDGDPTRLAQVFANLLTNASKYSDVDRKVTFVAAADERTVRVHVTDEGIGLAPELLHRVFDLFVQNRQSLDRSQGGLGLGLAIVRSLVALHGGTVHAHSSGEGQGAEFVVELPRAGVARHKSVRALPRPLHDVPKPTQTGERILVVDDNDDARLMLSEALGSLGYDVRTAGDGPSALRETEGFQPSVALLDLGLPVMDGYELAQRLRDGRHGSELRIVAVTGYGQVEDRQRSSSAGFDAHLVKPVSLDELERTLERLARVQR